MRGTCTFCPLIRLGSRSAHPLVWLCRVTLRNPMMFGARRSSGTAEGSEHDAREAIVFYRFILRTLYYMHVNRDTARDTETVTLCA